MTDSWKGIVESIETELGDIPPSLIQNQQPVADYVIQLVEGKVSEGDYFFAIKTIVAGAKVVSTRKSSRGGASCTECTGKKEATGAVDSK